MFFDASARLKLDEAGRLTHVRTAFVVDEYNSLLTVAELEIDTDEDNVLTPAEERKVLERVYEGFAPYDYFVDVRLGRSHTDPEVPVIAPSGGAVRMQDGQLAITLEVPLAEPLDLAGRTVSLSLYDPTYFTEIRTRVTPQFDSETACDIVLVPFEPNAETAQLASYLSQLGPNENPEAENLGIYLSDETVITCPAA